MGRTRSFLTTRAMANMGKFVFSLLYHDDTCGDNAEVTTRSPLFWSNGVDSRAGDSHREYVLGIFMASLLTSNIGNSRQ